MPKNPVLAVIRAIVAIAIVVVVFVTLVYQTDFERNHLSVLSITSTGIAGMAVKSETAAATDVTTSPVTAIKDAATTDPDQTGVYSSIWNGVNKQDRSVVLTIDVLPTVKQAIAAATDSDNTFYAPAAAKSYDKTVRFQPTFPNSVGGDLYTAATTQAKASLTEMILFRVKNIVVLSVLGGSVDVTRAQNIALAGREYQVIKKEGPNFSMFVKGHPGALSTLYFFGSALFIAFCFGGMDWIAAERERREAHRQAMIRYHYHSRGAKVLKRKAAPTRRR